MAGGKWSAMDPLAALSSGESSSSSDEEGEEKNAGNGKVVQEAVEADSESSKKKTSAGLDYEALSRHGYSGGLSIMNVPAPTQDSGDPNWSWSAGKRKQGDAEESIEIRERTREAIGEEAELAAARAVASFNFTKKQKRDAIAEQKAVSFAQKEKRKREMGQASRGKNYVEEEKRLLRDSGVYSGFDT